uniref:hypothetical protein n=1 Tax=Acetatifactor sp. TaxID=1872090 RepID=UPI0040576BE6
MNTIIYLFPNKEPENFITERWKEEDYTLIRLGIPALLWQSRNAQSSALLEELRHWQIAWLLRSENPYWTYSVYEDFLREKINPDVWGQYWVIPEFENYHESLWVEKLIPHTIPGNYMILGDADCIPRLLCENVGRMRSVKWYLPGEQYTEAIREFLDDYYEEFGLAVEVRLVEERWSRVHLTSVTPANILDFTGEEKLWAIDLPAGSIWLDMDSLEGKNRRIEVRNPEICYFSLKKLWKGRQKEGIHLDTIGKNRYNTIVK